LICRVTSASSSMRSYLGSVTSLWQKGSMSMCAYMCVCDSNEFNAARREINCQLVPHVSAFVGDSFRRDIRPTTVSMFVKRLRWWGSLEELNVSKAGERKLFLHLSLWGSLQELIVSKAGERQQFLQSMFCTCCSKIKDQLTILEQSTSLLLEQLKTFDRPTYSP